MRIATDVEIADSDLFAICRKYGVKELAVFGSAARGEMRRTEEAPPGPRPCV